MKSDGDFTFKHTVSLADSSRKNNDYTGNALFLKTQLQLGKTGELNLIHNNVRSDRGAAGQIALPSLQARRDERRHLTSLEWQQQLSPDFRIRARSYYHHSDQRFTDPGAWVPVNSRHENDVIGIESQLRWTLSSNVLFTTGGEFRQDKLESTDLGDPERNTSGIYFQPEITHQIIYGQLPILIKWYPALRWDNFSDITDRFNPKLGFLTTIGNEISISVRGNIGRSFRAPSFNDLYWPEDAFARGNTELRPEIGTNADIGISLQRHRNALWGAETTYFNNAIEDLIVWQAGPDWIWMPDNIGKVNISGIETSLRFHFPRDRAYIRFSYTRLEAIDKTEGSDNFEKQLIYRPKNKCDITAGTKLGFFRMNLIYRYVGARRYFNYDFNVNDYDHLPAYHIVNLNAGFDFVIAGFNIDLKVEVQNVLDKDIIILDGYPVPGREIRVSAGITY